MWQLLVIFAVFGIGFSMVNAPITNAAVSGMPTDRAGAASAVASTSRQVGVSLGVALCGSVAGAALAATGRGLRRRGAAAVAGLRRARRRRSSRSGLYSTSPRAMRSAERLAPLIAGTGCEGARRCPRNPLADEVWRAMAAWCIDNRDSWKRAVVERSGLPFSRIRILRRLARSADDGQGGRRGGHH